MKTPEEIADKIWKSQGLSHEETLFDEFWTWEDFVAWIKDKKESHVIYEDKTYFVVLADYTDSWDDQGNPKNEYLWSVARDSPTVKGDIEGEAIYFSKENAERRENQIIDHATKIVEWDSEKVREEMDKW